MAEERATDHADRFDARFWVATGAVCLLFALLWAFGTQGASLTHDEAVYVDVAEDPFESSFYPGDTFLRHPPLGLALLSAWLTVGLPLRAWPLLLSLAGILFLADAVRARGGSPAWLLPVPLAAPIAVPLLTVTLYPPMFLFLSLAAWAWARQRRAVEVVAWNLAVFTHELALLLLGVLLATKAARYVREGVDDPARWARLVWPYPAALAWGGVMLTMLVVASDGRGIYLSTIANPSPNIAEILQLKPWVGLVVLLTLAPLLADPRRDEDPASSGLTLASLAAIVAAPFYRYVLPLVPPLVARRADRPPSWWKRWGPAPLLLACLLVSGLAIGATYTGHDTLNAANLPGLVDHEEAVELIEANETVIVRSSPSFARVLADRGWRIQGIAATGPATVELARGNQTIVLHRAETMGRLQEVEDVDALVLPSPWEDVVAGLEDDWQAVDERGGATRWEPA